MMRTEWSTGNCLNLLMIGMLVVGLPDLAHSQQSGQNDPVLLSWKKQAGVQACGSCHYEPRGGNFATPDVTFSRQDELKFWLANDKHAIARRRVEPFHASELDKELADLKRLLEESGLRLETLPKDWFGASNALSRRICDKLGYDVTTAGGYAKFRDNCLTCHGGYQGASDNVAFAKDGGAQPGISCNYCHQIENNTAWIDVHGGTNAATQWRNLSPEEKAAKGMRDLVSAASQASNCFDCHVGNRDKNMFVTHVMYAAGHPPLPGIELQTFCESMPRHWQSEAELYNALASFTGRDAYYKANFKSLFDVPSPRLTPGNTYWNTRRMLIGALAAKLHSVQLLQQSASPDDRWADYSLYDCAACHHELREPSARQHRGYVSAPGRPRPSEWPDALLDVALDVAGSEYRTAADALNTKLELAFAQTPFGQPQVVVPVANELAKLLAAAVTSAESKPISAIAAREVIRRLALTPREKLLVYDSGRQVVWAIQAIAQELETQSDPLPPALAQQIKDLGAPTSSGIDARLPAGRMEFIYAENLNADLERKAAFSADELATRLAAIAAQIVVRP